MKIMAIDFGDARTGVAFSDISGIIAGETLVVKTRGLEKTAAELAELANNRQAGEIILGLPKNMDGSEGVRAEKSRALKAELEKLTDIPVLLRDERRTTVDAHNILSANNVRGQKRKNTVDAVAATLILEGYLNEKSR
ncbi:MAG: Holliday junction resolvase RuvX [Oscillospiraceae bacterium]|nr:Holliday junction resolvase RuvX [Oscillospiraceae bacterium]